MNECDIKLSLCDPGVVDLIIKAYHCTTTLFNIIKQIIGLSLKETHPKATFLPLNAVRAKMLPMDIPKWGFNSAKIWNFNVIFKLNN